MSKIIALAVVVLLVASVASTPLFDVAKGATGDVVGVTCVLKKVLPDGTVDEIKKSRAEVGQNKYLDYAEVCENEEEARALSAGTLASLAGK